MYIFIFSIVLKIKSSHRKDGKHHSMSVYLCISAYGRCRVRDIAKQYAHTYLSLTEIC